MWSKTLEIEHFKSLLARLVSRANLNTFVLDTNNNRQAKER